MDEQLCESQFSIVGKRRDEQLSKAELLLVRPEHVGFTLTILGHGLNSSSDAGELACSIVASVCGALTATHLKKDCTEWLVNSTET
eukprot:g28063.t1